MKNNKWITVVFALLIIGNLISCDDDADNYQENDYTLNSDIGLQYQNLSSYPYKEVVNSAQPDFKIDNTVYTFSILDIKKGGEILNAGKDIFSIDPVSGIISIDNSNSGLIPGETYSFDVGIGNVNGVIRNNDVFSMEVFDIPLNYTISNTTYDAKYLEVSDIATITYEDTSTSGDVLSDITYSLSDAPAGFLIDETTGVISKNTEATTGEHDISVIINSNIGPKTFLNVLKVTVGEAPTLTYVQSDNATPLSIVVLSPWTAYTSPVPQMVGMNAVAYEIVLPATLTAGAVIANNDGTITVLADQNLPLGTHVLGVIAENAAGITATFEAIFTLTVETRWESTAVFYEDFNNTTDTAEDLNTYNPALNSYFLNGTSLFKFEAQYTSNKGVYTAKLSEGKVNGGFDSAVDASMVLELTMQPEWRKMRVAFNEGFGFADNRLTWYERTLQSSHDISDLLAGNFDNSNWDVIMEANDPSWSGASVWKTLSSDADLNQVPTKEIAITPGNASIFLNWRVQKTGNATGGAAFLVDNIQVEVSNAFTAEEE